MRQIFPFTSIVGQEKMKMALILSVINPELGGVLIRGEKGTAKSTAVRSLAALLPHQEYISGCQFFCDPNEEEYWCDCCRDKYESKSSLAQADKLKRQRPMAELPIGATEDRVLGSLNLEKALTEGESTFEPGILAEANRAILYVDEVNLLDDHLVDILLDAAAMGRNIVEREGISISHPARFTLVGTMNPEEGELRPQLLDRFGLCVEVKGLQDVDQRKEVIKQRLKFEKNPDKFIDHINIQEQQLGQVIEQAANMLPKVIISDEDLGFAVELCLALGVDGHRGDLTVVKTALTLAALNGKNKVGRVDILSAAELALPHRMRRKPFQDVDFDVSARLKEAGII